MSFLLALLFFQAPDARISPTCKSVEGAVIYSDARYVEEAGDVAGVELAVFPRSDKPALLFIYEGTPFADPIPLSGNRAGAKIQWKGSAVEKLIKYPEKTEVDHTRSALLSGTITEKELVGTLQIEDGAADRVRLKKVKNLWICKAKK
jgi:hypothetical protein